MDPQQADLEADLRFANMILPKNVSKSESEELRSLLRELQGVIRRNNGYARDYKMAYEMLQTKNCAGLKLVIDAEKRPEGTHERTFNQGFEEISGKKYYFTFKGEKFKYMRKPK